VPINIDEVVNWNDSTALENFPEKKNPIRSMIPRNKSKSLVKHSKRYEHTHPSK